MTNSAPYDLKLGRLVAGIIAGALTTTLLCYATIGFLPGNGVLTLSLIIAAVAVCVVVVPFVIIRAKRRTLTIKSALITGALLTGLPTLLFNLTMQTPIEGDRVFVLTRTALAVLYGIAGAAVAWLIAIGARTEPPRQS